MSSKEAKLQGGTDVVGGRNEEFSYDSHRFYMTAIVVMCVIKKTDR